MVNEVIGNFISRFCQIYPHTMCSEIKYYTVRILYLFLFFLFIILIFIVKASRWCVEFRCCDIAYMPYLP